MPAPLRIYCNNHSPLYYTVLFMDISENFVKTRIVHKHSFGQKFGGQIFRRTKLPKFRVGAENFVRRKILSAENFVRRNILSAEFLSSS